MCRKKLVYIEFDIIGDLRHPGGSCNMSAVGKGVGRGLLYNQVEGKSLKVDTRGTKLGEKI